MESGILEFISIIALLLLIQYDTVAQTSRAPVLGANRSGLGDGGKSWCSMDDGNLEIEPRFESIRS
jgi:hypothetical protein